MKNSLLLNKMLKKLCASNIELVEVTYKDISGIVLPFIEGPRYLQVYRNGLFLTETQDYTTDSTKITMIPDMLPGDLIKLVFIR